MFFTARLVRRIGRSNMAMLCCVFVSCASRWGERSVEGFAVAFIRTVAREPGM